MSAPDWLAEGRRLREEKSGGRIGADLDLGYWAVIHRHQLLAIAAAAAASEKVEAHDTGRCVPGKQNDCDICRLRAALRGEEE